MRNPRLDEPDQPTRPYWREWYAEGNHGPFLGKADEEITSSATATVRVYAGTLGAETDTGDTVECYNRGDTVAAETWVNFIPRGGGYECFPLECP